MPIFQGLLPFFLIFKFFKAITLISNSVVIPGILERMKKCFKKNLLELNIRKYNKISFIEVELLHTNFIKSILPTKIHDSRTDLKNILLRREEYLEVSSCVLRVLCRRTFRFAYFTF